MLFLLVACGGSRSNDPVVLSQDSLDVAVEEIVDTAIIPATNNFLQKSIELDNAIESFCTSQSIPALETAQLNWKALADAWYRLQPYNFGPLNDDIVFPSYIYIDSLRLRGTDYTETVRQEIQRDILSEQALNYEYFKNKNFKFVGLLALEISLFDLTAADDQFTNIRLLQEYTSQPRKCDVLRGLSAAMLTRAEYINNGWTVSFKGEAASYRSLFLSGNIEDGSAPVNKIITSVQEYLDYLKNRGVVSISDKLSAHSWSMMGASLSEVKNMLAGRTQTKFNILDIMSAGGHGQSVETVKENIALAQSAIGNNDSVLFESAVAQLDGNFKREIPNGLEVELGITFTDGD